MRATPSPPPWPEIAALLGLPPDSEPARICHAALLHAPWDLISNVLQRHGAAAGEPYLDLLKAEAGSRSTSAGVHRELSALHSMDTAEVPEDLQLWARALLADHLLSTTSPEILAVVLAPVPEAQGPIAEISALRLERARLAVRSLNRSDAQPLALLQSVAQRFTELGAAEEAATTECVRASAVAVREQPAVEKVLPEILKACDSLIALETSRSMTALMLACGTCHLAEDGDRLQEYAVLVRERTAADAWERSALELFDAASSYRRRPDSAALNQAEWAFENFVKRAALPFVMVAEANNLLDYGRDRPARQVDALAKASPMLTIQTADGLAALRARLRFQDAPTDDNLDALRELVIAYEQRGHLAQASLLALRIAIDCNGADRTADALPMLRWASHLRPGEPSHRERRLEALCQGEGAGPPTAVMTLLAPFPRVDIDAEPVGLGRLGGLLLTLLALHPRGLHVETVQDALWPQADPATTRGRLNLLVHRVRRALGPDGEDLVRRRADSLVLNESGWRIDVWSFQRMAMSPSPDVRAAALDLYTTDLCSDSYAFCDLVVAAREELRSIWVDVAIQAMSSGSAGPEDIERRANSLHIRSPRLWSALTR